MNFKNIATITGLATGAAVAFTALPAQAISFTNLGNTCPTAYCVDLEKGGYTVSGGDVLTGDISPVALTPGSNDDGGFDPDNTSADTKSYNVTTALAGADDPGELDPVAASPITVTGLDGMFEFFWGSVDQHNQIEFKNGDTTVLTFNGQELVDALNFSEGVELADGTPNQAGNFKFDIYLNFFSQGEDDFFDTVVLSSIPGLVEDKTNGISFEVATKKAIPEPASILGLAIVGLLGSGSMLKRREQSA